MAWIRMIRETAAEGELAESYQRYREPSGRVDNILRIHSLNPPSLEGHYQLYRHLCLLFIHPRAPNLINLRSASTMPA